MGERADAIVIGAGHNGLAAACYLAEAGLRVTVLERREVIGGAAVSEELIPGFTVSSASYSMSLLRPDVVRDLGLERHGLSWRPKDPQMFVPSPDGRSHFFVWRDGARTREEVARFSPHDAEALAEYGDFWEDAIALLRPLAESADPPPLRDVERILRDRGREDVWRLAVVGSAADCVEHFFESDEMRGAFVGQGIIGTYRGPRDPGTAWVMAYHYLGGELNGSTGTWAYVRGGMGSVSQALAAAAAERGVVVRTGAPVAEILVEAGHVRGVRLQDGETVEAPLVLSNADPKRTYLGLVPEDALEPAFLERVRGFDTTGSVIKVNLALAELPDFVARPGTAPGPQHAGTIEISPSVAYSERAFADALDGRPSREPFMEVFIQSATDDTLAPPGKHVLSAFTMYAPADTTRWEDKREEAYRNVVGTLARYAPNLPDAILAAEVLGPPELEERFGLTGGNIFHGEITPEQSFGERFSYRSPLEGLYLCGSGAPPGGGVMAAAGRNAARAALAFRARA